MTSVVGRVMSLGALVSVLAWPIGGCSQSSLTRERTTGRQQTASKRQGVETESGASRTDGAPDGALRFEKPKQRQQAQARRQVLAEVPPGLNTAPAVTLEVESVRETPRGTKAARYVLTRRGDRAHLAYVGRGQEWLFVQNPVDGRRLSAVLIDHKERAILQHQPADLDDLGMPVSWSIVATAGVDPHWLSAMTPTGGQREMQGHLFRQFANSEEQHVELSPMPNSLWWCEALWFALETTMSVEEGGAAHERVVAWRLEADDSLLSDPTDRFPDYLAMDVVDWREEHHGGHTHDKSAGGHASSLHGHAGHMH